VDGTHTHDRGQAADKGQFSILLILSVLGLLLNVSVALGGAVLGFGGPAGRV
jgi:hypothetical protein